MQPTKTIAMVTLTLVVLATCLVGLPRRAQSDNYAGSTDYQAEVQNEEVVLFPFDNYAVPFRSGLQLSLVEGRLQKSPVLPLGRGNQPDSLGISFYGTVIRMATQLRMWYLCAGDREKGVGFSWLPGARWRVCYAVSTDGINWEKPNLGLVEYGGNTQNNLVGLDPYKQEVISCVVIYDPDDPNPTRRFKMMYEAHGGVNSAAYSRDGLVWTNSPRNPVIRIRFEPTGLIKHHGLFYAVGHTSDFNKRLLAVHASADFESWTEAVSLGFRRDYIGTLHPPMWGKQVHLGAGLWDRGNVILGLYGQWNELSPESNDRRDIRMNLGLVISHDAIHYHEPIPNFQMISSTDMKFPTLGFRPALAQGQAFLNLGEKTLAWYSLWGPGGSDGVYLATWDRDRLGYYYVSAEPIEGQRPSEGVAPHFVSCPIRLDKAGTKVYVNSEGLGEYSNVTVEILDESFEGIPGYSGSDSVPLTTSGLRQQIGWRNNKSLPKFDHPVRIRVNFGGLQVEHARVYAVYLN